MTSGAWPRLLPAWLSVHVSIAGFHMRELKRTWCDGKIRVSAMTTFSLRVAEKTMTSAMSSGVNGSTPLLSERQSHQASLADDGHGEVGDLRVDSIGLRLVTVEANNRELLS